MFDTGSTGFMLTNTMLMTFLVIGVVGVLWVVAGWSFAYGGDGSISFFGGFDQLRCLPIVQQGLDEAAIPPADAAALAL